MTTNRLFWSLGGPSLCTNVKPAHLSSKVMLLCKRALDACISLVMTCMYVQEVQCHIIIIHKMYEDVGMHHAKHHRN